MWTKLFDMSSGGSEKLGATTIWIEANEDEAEELFEEIFGIDPNNVTCPCCGNDYSIWESKFEPNDGDWVVNKNDIERFKGGNRLTFDS